MPKKQVQNIEKTASVEEKSAQNLKMSTKSVTLRTKSKNTSKPAKVGKQSTECSSIATPVAVQKNTTNQKQVSRSTILFVASMNYLVFFAGFCACRHEPFARFHQNQALWMWIIVIILYLSFAFIPGVNRIAIPFVIMLHILWIFAGVGTALRGRAYAVPIVGKIRIIDWEKV